MPKSLTNNRVFYPGALGQSVAFRASLVIELQAKLDQQKIFDEALRKQLLAIVPRGLKRYVEDAVITRLFQYGKCDDKVYFSNGDNSDYGFRGIEDVKKKIASLKKAWNKIVRIEMREPEEHRVHIIYSAVI